MAISTRSRWAPSLLPPPSHPTPSSPTMPSYIVSLLAPILAKLGLGLNRSIDKASTAPDLEAASSTSCVKKDNRSTPPKAEHTSMRDRVMQGWLYCCSALKRRRKFGHPDSDMEKGPEQRLLRAHRTDEKEEEEEEEEEEETEEAAEGEEEQDEGAEVAVEVDWEDEDVQERVKIGDEEEGEEKRQQQQQQQQRRQQQQQQWRRREKENAQRSRLNQTHSVERLQPLAQQTKRDMFECAARTGLQHLRRVEADLTASLADPQACIEAHLAKWAAPSAGSRQQSIREEVELILADPEPGMQRVRGTLEEMAVSRLTPEERGEQRRRQEREEEKQRQSRQEDPQQKARRAMLKSFDRSAHMWRHNPEMLQRVEASRALYEADPEAYYKAQDAKRARWWDELNPEDRSRLQAELDAVNLKYKDEPNSSLARLERRCVDSKARSVVWKRAIQARRRRQLREQEEELERGRLERRAEWADAGGLAATSTSASQATVATASGQDAMLTPVTAAAGDGETATPATNSGTRGDLPLAQ